MSEQAIWGLLILIYVVPFWLWQISEHSTIEARKKLYPGRSAESQRDSQFTYRSITWCVGLVALMAAWKAEWHPVATGATFLLAALSALAVYFAVARLNLMENRPFRFWIAGSIVGFPRFHGHIR